MYTTYQFAGSNKKEWRQVNEKQHIGIVEKYRKQAWVLVCITEPLLCYMNSGCVLESRDTPTSHTGNNLIPIYIRPFPTLVCVEGRAPVGGWALILQSHRTQNMILRCYPNVSAILRKHTCTKIYPVLFQQSLYFLIYRILVSALFLHALHSSRSFAPPKKCYFSMVTWGTSARARRAQAQNIAWQLHNVCLVQYSRPNV